MDVRGVADCRRVAKPENVAHVKGPSEDTYNGNRVTALSEAEIDSYVDKFAQAAKNAIAAGFDGTRARAV